MPTPEQIKTFADSGLLDKLLLILLIAIPGLFLLLRMVLRSRLKIAEERSRATLEANRLQLEAQAKQQELTRQHEVKMGEAQANYQAEQQKLLTAQAAREAANDAARDGLLTRMMNLFADSVQRSTQMMDRFGDVLENLNGNNSTLSNTLSGVQSALEGFSSDTRAFMKNQDESRKVNHALILANGQGIEDIKKTLEALPFADIIAGIKALQDDIRGKLDAITREIGDLSSGLQDLRTQTSARTNTIEGSVNKLSERVERLSVGADEINTALVRVSASIQFLTEIVVENAKNSQTVSTDGGDEGNPPPLDSGLH